MPENSEPKKVNWKNVSIGAVIGAILISLGLLVLLLLQPKAGTPTSSTTPKIATTSAKKDETAGWEIYTNTTFGYSIKFPNNYKVPPQTEGQISQLGLDTNICIVRKKDQVCTIVINAFENKEKQSLKDWLKNNQGVTVISGNATEATFNNYRALVGVAKYKPSLYDYLVAHNQTVVEITTYGTDEEKRVLSTFKFLD